MLRLFPAGLLLALFAATPFHAEEKKGEDGFIPMFNGKDLAGWVNVNCAPGTFYVKDGMIVTTGKPTGYLRTEKQYENFVAEFEWMHVPPKADAVGNSGFFVWADALPALGTGYTRGIEVQVLVNLTYTDKKSGAVTASSHGDIFSIHGATCEPERPHPAGAKRCMPAENRAKGANEWNHYRIEANDGVIKLAVNGKVVSSVSKSNPRKGYLALEAEGSECRFRNLKVKELPSTNPTPDQVAEVAIGFQSAFNGLDLNGWKAESEDGWKAGNGILRSVGKGGLTRTFSGVPYEVRFDWKVAPKAEGKVRVLAGGKEIALTGKAGGWNRATVTGEKPDFTFLPADGLEIRSIFHRPTK